MADASATLPAPGAIDDALARVLARREFASATHAPSALDDLRRWLQEQWDALWSWLRGVVREGIVEVVGTSWLVEVVVVGLVVAATALLVRRVRRRHPARHTRATSITAPADDRTRVARAHLALAASAAAAGRHLEAARALYLGVVFWLAAAGALRFDDAATGDEYARTLPQDGTQRSFRALLGAFYPLAFGERPATADVYARMREAATALGVPE